MLGFSFSAKKWGELTVENLSPVVFDETAFDTLVLPTEKKALIRALVENCGDSFSDIISGKGGGCIFLLHGSPGVGKVRWPITFAIHVLTLFFLNMFRPSLQVCLASFLSSLSLFSYFSVHSFFPSLLAYRIYCR